MNFRVKKNFRNVTCIVMFAFLWSCVSVPEKVVVGNSYLKDTKNQELQTDLEHNNRNVTVSTSSQKLQQYSFKDAVESPKLNSNFYFDDKKVIALASDELPLNEFLHYVLGEVLGVSYVLGDNVKADETLLTLSIQKPITHKGLYRLVESMLSEREYVIRFSDEIFFINQKTSNSNTKNFVYGYGSKAKDVPESALPIWQYVPFKYGFNGSLQMTISQFANVQVYPEPRNNVLVLRGKREEILKALELFNLVDSPTFTGREIAIYRAVYNDVTELTTSLKQIMLQEGISVSGPEQNVSALSVIPLPQIGAFLLFANDSAVIERALYWSEEIDQPQEGDKAQYFIYVPKYSRATDLGTSLSALLGGGGSAESNSSARKENAKLSNNRSNNLGMVIDQRANSIIFNTTGSEYKELLPLIKRLDVTPKQIMLEMLIAEVTLTDEFAMGVEFSLKNGSYTASTNKSFGLDAIGGLQYVLKGINDTVQLNMFESNSLVEVLSRPSIVVRDGVAANIKIGTKLPTVGGTTSDPNGERLTTEVIYQQTGVELTVTPTLNAQGVVIMEIDQNISNEFDTGKATVGGSPAIFERVIKTEAVANSGQTIILGGLISTRTSTGRNGVPGLKDLPVLGGLFRADKEDTTKTELVIMVTPRVIESGNEWERVKQDLQQQLKTIDIRP